MLSLRSSIRQTRASTRRLDSDLRHSIHSPLLESPIGVGDPVLVRPDEELRRDVKRRLALYLRVAEDGTGNTHDVRAGCEVLGKDLAVVLAENTHPSKSR